MSYDYQLKRHLDAVAPEQGLPACLDTTLRVQEWAQYYPAVHVPDGFFAAPEPMPPSPDAHRIATTVLDEHAGSADFREAKMDELEERLEDCERRLRELNESARQAAAAAAAAAAAPSARAADDAASAATDALEENSERVYALHSILEDVEQVSGRDRSGDGEIETDAGEPRTVSPRKVHCHLPRLLRPVHQQDFAAVPRTFRGHRQPGRVPRPVRRSEGDQVCRAPFCGIRQPAERWRSQRKGRGESGDELRSEEYQVLGAFFFSPRHPASALFRGAIPPKLPPSPCPLPLKFSWPRQRRTQVHPDNLTEVKCHVLRHLPIFAFPNKDGSPHNPAITS
ncbi:MAG: hypothetical protein BJ554DRAFT_4537, partial [Olpidium bornovanus]